MMRLSWDDFCDAVREAVDSLPPGFGPYLENVVVDVENDPSPEDLERLQDRTDASTVDGLLLGLFIGVPLTEQGYGDHYPNRVVIYRRPTQRVSRTRRALLKNIRATVIHEFAHHFGFSESDLEDFERSQEKWLD